MSTWPVFVVGNAALADVQFTTMKRDDSVQQSVYQGKPLYLYVGDAKPGESNGDGQGGVWHVLRANKKIAAASQSVATVSAIVALATVFICYYFYSCIRRSDGG